MKTKRLDTIFKIINSKGEVKEIEDGVYQVNAKITIFEGKIARIDDGIWNQEVRL